jgi:hypothetical protein
MRPRPRHFQRLVLASAGTAMLTATALPATAAAPTREPFTMLSIACRGGSDLGSVELNVAHSSTGAGSPGGDIVVWAPGADPASDLPLLSGYEEAIDRDGATLRGSIPLRAGGGDGPGQGIQGGLHEPEDPAGGVVGEATYEVTFAHAGPSTSEVVRGPIVDSGFRTNQRYSNHKERTPVTATAVLTLPGSATIDVTSCTGEEVVESVFITEPATKVASRRDPFGFECAADGDGATALVQVTGGESSVVIVPDGTEDAIAFGSAFVDETRRSMTSRIAMVSPEGEDLGEATLEAQLHPVERTTARYGDGSTTTTAHVELVVADGTVTFARATYRFEGCQDVRVREHLITRAPARVPGR